MIAQMFELMYAHEGVGLAANQVDLPYRFFISNSQGDPEVKEAEQVFINPVLKGGKGNDEGCLSIPGVSAPVERKERIIIEAYNLAGESLEVEVEGLLARIVQHETDHLDGRLFIDRLATAHRAELRSALEEFEIEFQSLQSRGDIPDNDHIAARLSELESARC